MDRTLCIVTLLCWVALCKGVELSIDLDGPTRSLPGAPNTCGILICTQDISNVSSIPDIDPYLVQAGSNILFSSIHRMSLFIKAPNDNTDRSSTKGQRNVEIGSITATSPNLTRVANGKKTTGLLELGLATIQVELMEDNDCQHDYVCEVRGVDIQGREVVSSASLKQQFQTGNHIDGSLQLFTAISQLVNGLENRIEDKFLQQQKDLSQMQKELNTKIDFLENRIEDRIQSTEDKREIFENDMESQLKRVDDKIDDYNTNELNKLLWMETKVSEELSIFRNETKEEIVDTLEKFSNKSAEDRKQILRNFAQTSQRTLTEASRVLTSIERDLEMCRDQGQSGVAVTRNQTVAPQDIQLPCTCPTCPQDDTSYLRKDYLLGSCYLNMSKDTTQTYEPFETMMDPILNREILCDTKTDGGGWIVIQRRTYGDVNFYRNWEDYKLGFGKMPFDFWLGNEAIHNITSTGVYELRIDLEEDGQNYFARYSSFGIADESDKYRLRLGYHSGTLEEKNYNYGLSYSNGYRFSTYDEDNDEDYYHHCAKSNDGAWWYNECHRSHLNGMWGQKTHSGLRWHSGQFLYYAARTEMKIRRV